MRPPPNLRLDSVKDYTKIGHETYFPNDAAGFFVEALVTAVYDTVSLSFLYTIDTSQNTGKKLAQRVGLYLLKFIIEHCEALVPANH